MLQLSGNKGERETAGSDALRKSGKKVSPRRETLLDLKRGDHAFLDHIDLPADDARRLMELGFCPGTRVTAGFSAPGGDPRVFQVDGSEIALRRETAGRVTVRRAADPRVP